MDVSVQLRRQFRKRAANPLQCLILKGGIWHYSRRVPAAVLALDPSFPKQIRRSTKTEIRREAQFIAREWAEQDESEWIALVEGRQTFRWAASLSEGAKDAELFHAIDAIEARADALGLRDDMEDARGASDLPEALREDPATRKALQTIDALNGRIATWVEAWEHFEHKRGSTLARRTRLAYASAARQLDKARLPGPHDVTRDRIKQYLRGQAQRAKPSTVNVYVSAGTAILTELFDDDENRANMFRGHSLRYANKAGRRAALTRDDIKAMIETGSLSREATLMMRLALGTGARRQEVYNGEYDLERNVLTVFAEIAKSDASARAIPLASRLLPVAKEWVKLRSSAKFPKLTSLAAQVQRARDLAKLPASKVLHSCRHSFTTELERAGVPRSRQEALTGHKARDVHASYLHLGVEDLRADVEKVDFETGIPWP